MRDRVRVSPVPWLDAASRVLGALLDAWLPASCVLCAADHRRGLCEHCERALPGYRIARCPRCGLAAARADATCSACTAAPPAFAGTIVLADYAAPLDRLIHTLKFGRDASLAAPLGICLARCCLARCLPLPPTNLFAPCAPSLGAGPGDAAPANRNQRPTAGAPLAGAPLAGAPLVTAIPLSTKRLSGRGFNQSLEIARALASALSLPLDHRLLRRVRESAPASTLNAGERHRALRGAFHAPSSLSGRTVLVVDDVMTTGATLQAAAEALTDAGAAFVFNCVVARTPAADDPSRTRSP